MLSMIFAASLTLPPVPQSQQVRVFILAGQSNMQGHGIVAADPTRNEGKGSLEAFVKNPNSSKTVKQLLSQNQSWNVRDDVWIHYLNRKGKLTAGYGANQNKIGPELGFGIITGNAYQEPVLLIKLAWGGKSLAVDFRPPSSGGTVGPYYTTVIQESKKLIANFDTEFPELKGRRIELSGFSWHQGWNDRINTEFVNEYEANMANFIRDVRKDLNAPNLPFVIAETGMTGPNEKHERALALMTAQANVTKQKEFQYNVAFVSTRSFWRPQEISPSGQGYHWNTNAETYYLIGEAMGRSMLELLKRKTR